MADDGKRDKEEMELGEAVRNSLLESRSVLPGVQSLFGFQLIATLNPRFEEALTEAERWMHLTALVLTAVSAGLLMTPAAYHRQTNPRTVSGRMLTVFGRLTVASMVPLAVAVGLDVYLAARLSTGSAAVAGGVAGGLAFLWFVLPRVRGLRRRLGGE